MVNLAAQVNQLYPVLTAQESVKDVNLSTIEIDKILDKMISENPKMVQPDRVKPLTYKVNDKLTVQLTEQQLAVLRLIAKGLTTDQQAASMNLAVKTIESHRCRLFVNLGAKNAPHVVALGFMYGIL